MVHKLPVHDTLTGEKLGIQRSHAEDCLKKLSQAYQPQLRGHLRVYWYAKSLSPDSIGTLSLAEAHEAIDGIAHGVQEWPSCLMAAMFRKNATEMVQQMKAEADDACTNFEALYELMRPGGPVPEGSDGGLPERCCGQHDHGAD